MKVAIMILKYKAPLEFSRVPKVMFTGVFTREKNTITFISVIHFFTCCSFGVVLWELITGKEAITESSEGASLEPLTTWVKFSVEVSFKFRILGKIIFLPLYFQVKGALSTELQICDPALGISVPPEILHQLVLLAQNCTEIQGKLRPSTKEVLKRLKEIGIKHKRVISTGDVEEDYQSYSSGIGTRHSSTSGAENIGRDLSSKTFEAPFSTTPNLK